MLGPKHSYWKSDFEYDFTTKHTRRGSLRLQLGQGYHKFARGWPVLGTEFVEHTRDQRKLHSGGQKKQMPPAVPSADLQWVSLQSANQGHLRYHPPKERMWESYNAFEGCHWFNELLLAQETTRNGGDAYLHRFEHLITCQRWY